jgi:hypothetical protein
VQSRGWPVYHAREAKFDKTMVPESGTERQRGPEPPRWWGVGRFRVPSAEPRRGTNSRRGFFWLVAPLTRAGPKIMLGTMERMRRYVIYLE